VRSDVLGFFPVLLSILIGSASFSAEARASAWNELQSKALNANPELQSLKANFDASVDLNKVSYSSYWPQFSLFAEETRRDVNDPEVFFNSTTNTFTLLKRTMNRSQQTYGLKTSVELFSGFSTGALIDRTSAEVDRARAQLDLKSIELRYTLSSQYIQWISAQKSVRTSREILKRQKQNRDLIQIKYDNGLEAKWALEQADVAYRLSELQIESDLRDLANAQQLLSQLVQEPVKLSEAEVAPEIAALPELTDEQLESHPQIRYYRSQSAEASASRRLGRSEFYPVLGAAYSWSAQKEGSDEQVKQSAVSLTLTWNLFNGFASSNRLSAAVSAQSSAELAERAFREKLRIEISQLRSDYHLLMRTLQLKSLELKTAQSRATTVSRQYRNGQRRYDDWEEAQFRLINLEREIVSFEKQALLLRASWERSVGLKLGDT
jgi:outer membrane protein